MNPVPQGLSALSRHPAFLVSSGHGTGRRAGAEAVVLMWWRKTQHGSGGESLTSAAREVAFDAARVPTRSASPEPDAGEVVLFAYVDGTLVEVRQRAEVDTVDGAILRALELANDDWTEGEAAAEMSRVTGASVAVLDGACHRMVGALARNPVTDVRGIRATRIVVAALRRPAPPGTGPAQRDGCAPWTWPADDRELS
jgi:hypothetical protein